MEQSEPSVPAQSVKAAMQLSMEHKGRARHGSVLRSRRAHIFAEENLPEKIALAPRQKAVCDKPSAVRRVMLHLRARYVSKAAILTIPVLLVSVENRSPA